jgi:hypothetical protein
LFLEYGFVDLHIGRYQKNKDEEIRAELYRFDSPADAFGMYSQERNPKHPFIDIGVQAYREEGVLNFLTGPYYVKIMTHLRGEEALDAMTTIAKSLNVRLKQQNHWPSPINLLPSRQKQSNSEQYIAKSFLGYSFLRRAYVAQYGDAVRFRVFVIAEESPENSESTFREFMKTVPGGVLDTLTVEQYRVRDQYNGPIELLRTGNILAGVIGLDDRTLVETYFNDILKKVGADSRRNHIAK